MTHLGFFHTAHYKTKVIINYKADLIFVTNSSVIFAVDPFPDYNRTLFVSISRFSQHSLILILDKLGREAAFKVKAFYEFLLISSQHLAIMQTIAKEYREFRQYGLNDAKNELLHTRWNFDEFVLIDSQPALEVLYYYENQLPTFMQEQDERFKTNNVSDLDLRYYITSGYGQRCTHENLYEKLIALTYNFNAYDRIFCDAVEYHGLQLSFKAHWNHDDMFYLKGRLIRDGIVSTFPPDASTAVYYASPKLTFVVLQRNAITWMFVARPFQRYVWIVLIVTFTILEIYRHLKQFTVYWHELQLKYKIIKATVFKIVTKSDVAETKDMGNRYARLLEISNGILRVLMTSAYGGMILVGILKPLYPFTPNTFEELNNTKNYFVATALHSSEDIMLHLLDKYILNKIAPEMRVTRSRNTPAEYIEFSISTDFKERKANNNKYYAAVMYDDKMDLWMRGRFIIWRTAPFLGQIKPAKDKEVGLSEIRYFSVASGATRLRFILVTMKRVFTSGTWMKWFYLEKNYYKNVAPILAVKKLNEMGMEPARDEHEPRQLTLHDLFPVFAIKGLGLVIAFHLICFENACEIIN